MVRLPRLVSLALILMFAALPARADDLRTIVAGLGGDGFVAKEKAVVALGKLGDPRAVPILQALGEDRLRKASDGRIVIVAVGRETTKLSDAATGQELPDLAPDALDRIIVNNRLRGAIEGALGALTLFSPDRGARLAAAQDALRHPSAETVALLDKAIAAEQDSEIRAAMQRSLFGAHLFAGSKEERLAAIRALSTATDPQVKNLIDACLCRLCRAATVPRLSAVGVDRRLSRRRGAGCLPVRRHVRRRARTLPDPLSLWPAARNPAGQLGRQPDPAADGALDLRLAEQGGGEP